VNDGGEKIDAREETVVGAEAASSVIEEELAGKNHEVRGLVKRSEVLQVPGLVGIDDHAGWRFEGFGRRGVDEVGEFGDDERDCEESEERLIDRAGRGRNVEERKVSDLGVELVSLTRLMESGSSLSCLS